MSKVIPDINQNNREQWIREEAEIIVGLVRRRTSDDTTESIEIVANHLLAALSAKETGPQCGVENPAFYGDNPVCGLCNYNWQVFDCCPRQEGAELNEWVERMADSHFGFGKGKGTWERELVEKLYQQINDLKEELEELKSDLDKEWMHEADVSANARAAIEEAVKNFKDKNMNFTRDYLRPALYKYGLTLIHIGHHESLHKEINDLKEQVKEAKEGERIYQSKSLDLQCKVDELRPRIRELEQQLSQQPTTPPAQADYEREVVYGVWKSGWESSHLEGLYATKELADKALAHFVAENQKEVDAMYGKDSEDYKETPEHNDKMHNEFSFRYNQQYGVWSNCLDTISISEHTIKGRTASAPPPSQSLNDKKESV